ncbi:zinc ribbon domain-containing protein [Streptomyces sp. NPDC006335]|uniref:zinc ribbon domain-containing protein n=1 Tax=Streptomyces sp. NPDC006335 TaxID=3156895 RepID=UPI0033B71E07
MSDTVYSVIPTDPHWLPDRDAGDRATALVTRLAPEDDGGFDTEIETDWYDTVTAVDCGENLTRISCPACGAPIDPEWYRDLIEAHGDDGFATLAVTVPCCGAATSLDALEYDWPCGFARFEIAVWNPAREPFDERELAAVGEVLGHPVRQIRARI